jgi:iron complex outermembrane receptor protein
MVRRAEFLVAALLLASPAAAQEARVQVAIPAGRLDAAMLELGRQAGISIGADRAISGVRVRGVRGRLTPGEALHRLLAGTSLRVRRVAPGSYLIERDAVPRRKPPPARPAGRPPIVSPPAPAPEEIVVTGTKRDVPLYAYPGGVQILDGDDLSKAEGGHGTDAIAERVASLSSTHLGPGRNKLFIRGIADSSFVGPTQATVGQYWGNSRITYSAPDPSLRLYDIGRVEVLEGPQATLYGAGSLGGVLRVVPRAPNLSVAEGQAWAGAELVEHGDPGGDAGAVVNLPIVADMLAVRALAYGSVEGGYIDDRERHLEDVNRVRTVGGRVAVRLKPGNDWTIDVNGVGQRILGDDSQYADRGGDGLSRASAVAQPYQNDFWLGEIVVRKQWGSLELTTSVALAEQYVSERFEGVESLDPDQPYPFALPPASFTQINRIDMLTTETRLARNGPDGTGWLIGLSAIHNWARVNRRLNLDPLWVALTGVRNRAEEATLFGEWTFAPLHRLSVTLGGRLTHARLAGSADGVDPIVAFRLDPGARATRSETRLLPSAALAFKASDRVTVFGRYQQGFRPGGLAVRRDFIQRFNGDRLSTIEAGIRYTAPAVEIAATGSQTWWHDIQADLIDGYGFPATANIGDGRVTSLGLSGRWRPVGGIEFDASLYLNGSKVTLPSETINTVGGMDASSRLPNVADASGRLGASYRTALAGDLQLQASGYVRYVGRSTLGIGSVLGQLQGDYADTGLDLRLARGAGALTLSITNLLDSRGNRFALGTPFLIRDRNQITPLQPRSLRLGVEYAF